jgi:hypothetical protein
MTIHDGIAPCDVTITAQDKVRIISGPDLQQAELNDLKSEGGFHARENDDYLRCRSGTSQESLRYGDWNHIVVIQTGFTRTLVVNGVYADASHHGGRPATLGQYVAALLPAAAGKGYTNRPVHSLRIGGLQPEMVGFRGWVGPASVWEKPFAATANFNEVQSMYWNNLVSNIFHPYFDEQPHDSELPKVDTTASVWTLGRNDTESLGANRDAIRDFVQMGGSLCVPIASAQIVTDLNAVFGWRVHIQDAPLACVIPDPSKPEKQAQVVIPAQPAAQRDLPAVLGNDFVKSPKMSTDNLLAVDVASLPPNATELYTSSVVHAFTTSVGDGRVSYIGFQGHGRSTTSTADQNTWKTILVRLMRGQRQLDM